MIHADRTWERIETRLFLSLLIVCRCAFAQSPGPSAALLRDCADPSSVLAEIRPADPIQVRYSVAGGSDACYAVRAIADGRQIDGYLLGPTHPAIEEFVRGVQADIPVPPAPPAPVEPADPKAKLKDAASTEPISFAGFQAVDVSGHRVDLSAMNASHVILYFWSATDPTSLAKGDDIESLYLTYNPRGLAFVGVAATPSAAKLRQFAQRNEITWPLIADSGELAKQYHVNPEKPYMILDRQRNVLTAVGTSNELEPILQRLMAGRSTRSAK
jgi:peroxiredoxin